MRRASDLEDPSFFRPRSQRRTAGRGAARLIVALALSANAVSADTIRIEGTPSTNFGPDLSAQVFEENGPVQLNIEWKSAVLSRNGEPVHSVDFMLEIQAGFNTVFGEGPEYDLIQNVLRDVRGRLVVDGQRVFDLKQENFADFFARADLSPTDEDIVFFIPVSLTEEGTASRPNHSLMFLRFNKRSLEWNTGGFSDLLTRAINSSGRDLGAFFEALARPEMAQRSEPPRVSSPQQETTVRLTSSDPAVLSAEDCREAALPLTEKEWPNRSCGMVQGKSLELFDEPRSLEGAIGDKRLLVSRLTLLPGPSATVDGRIVNRLDGVEGQIRVLGGDHEEWLLALSAEHQGNRFGRSEFNPETEELAFSLPIALRAGASPPILATLDVECRIEGDSVTCSSGSIVHKGTKSLSTELDALLGEGGDANPIPPPLAFKDPGCVVVKFGIGCDHCFGQAMNCNDCDGSGACSISPAGCPVNNPEQRDTCCVSNTMCGCRDCVVPQSPPGGGGGCWGPEYGITHVVPVADPIPEALELELPPYRLFRTYEGQNNLVHLGEEWLVMQATPDRSGRAARLEILNSSSNHYHDSRRLELQDSNANELFAGVEAPQTYLVVDAPVHPENSRRIELPDVSLRRAASPFPGPVGLAVVRVQVDENRTLLRSDLLFSSAPVTSALADWVAQNLTIAYKSEKRHPVSVFAVLRLDRGQVVLEDARVFIPLCCEGPPVP